MVQLTTEQRVFVITTYTLTQSVTEEQNAFRIRFPDRNPPDKKTILKNLQKYQTTGTSLNRNKGNSGRRRTALSEENVAVVRDLLEETPRGVSARRNHVEVSKSSFNRITRLDLRWHPYRMQYGMSYCQTTCHVDCAMRNGLINAVKTPIFCKASLLETKQDLPSMEKLTPRMCASMHRRDIHRHLTSNA